jgi:hypothetical protein
MNVCSKLVFLPIRPFQPSLMFSDKAKPISGAPKRCSTEKGCDLTHKHLTGLERLARDKCSSLLWKGITDARKKFYNIGHWSVWLFQAHVDPEELFRKIFGEFSRGFRNSGRGGFQDIFEDFSPFGFGFGAQETVVNLTFQQAARGVTKEIEIIQATGTARLPSLTKANRDQCYKTCYKTFYVRNLRLFVC